MINYTAEEKVRLAIDWVAKQEPWVIPVVLVKWAVSAIAERSKCPTMQTNGRAMNYNPQFVDRLSLSAVKCVVLHEVAHCINQHHVRRGNRNPKGWNIACDLAINSQLWRGYVAAYNGDVDRLVAELIRDPKTGGCFVGYGPFADLPPNLSAEEYYDLLKSRNPTPTPTPTPTGQGGGSGADEDEGEGEGSGSGADRDGLFDDAEGEGSGSGSGEDEGEGSGSGSGEDEGEGSGSGSGSGEDEGEGSGSGSGSGSGEDEGEGEGSGTALDPSDFEDTDEGGGFSESDGGNGKLDGNGKDPFADLPDPTETFGGGVEDAPDEVTLREEEGSIILETLLGGDSYGRTGLGEFMSKFKDRLEGDPEVAAQVNWRRELEKFLRVQHAAGWKYDRPSRRHSHRGDVVLPARRAKSKTRGLCIVDTSGSMADSECEQSIAHLGKILALFPQSTVTLAMCDTAVRSSKEYRACDFPIREFEGWKGRGGTELAPAFRWAKERKAKFDWLIVVSDMEWCWWMAPDPSIPTLWINTSSYLWCSEAHRLPFGKLVNFHAQQQRQLAA